MVATRVGKDKSQRSTIKIIDGKITYLAASPSSQVLNCIPALYNCGFVRGRRGKTGKEFISKPGETNNLFMWKFFFQNERTETSQNETTQRQRQPV